VGAIEGTCEAGSKINIEPPPPNPPAECDRVNDGEPDDKHEDHATSIEGNLAKVIPFPSRRR